MIPEPTAEQFAVARQIARRLSQRLPESGVLDYEDVASMAIEALLRLIDEGKLPDDERWLGTRIRSRTIDFLRSEGVLSRVRDEHGDQHYERRETATEEQTMGLGDLEPAAEKILRLTFEHDLTAERIAERMGRTPGSVCYTRSRALHQLRGEVSVRELEVMVCAANGLSAKETAKELNLSHHTVRHHRKGAIASLRARSMTHAVAVAFRRGLLV